MCIHIVFILLHPAEVHLTLGLIRGRERSEKDLVMLSIWEVEKESENLPLFYTM